ncbi:hypothetical protein [Accumulibacter sp.]|uniref:hypothetical protein n=1 Tax=Accumulibacter sp. TaxID=2053492 RepID=UPI00344E8AE6
MAFVSITGWGAGAMALLDVFAGFDAFVAVAGGCCAQALPASSKLAPSSTARYIVKGYGIIGFLLRSDRLGGDL